MCHKAGGWGRGGCGIGRRGKGGALGSLSGGGEGRERSRSPGEGRLGEGEEEEPGNTVGLLRKGGERKVRSNRKGGGGGERKGLQLSPSLYFTFP